MFAKKYDVIYFGAMVHLCSVPLAIKVVVILCNLFSLITLKLVVCFVILVEESPSIAAPLGLIGAPIAPEVTGNEWLV